MPQCVLAPAKLNLTLDVLGKRPDGYHDLRMLMQSVDLCDTLTVEAAGTPGLSLEPGLPFLPRDEGNLAIRAARVFCEAQGIPLPDLALTIQKRIPVCAGMAGGSSDAAAVLRALRDRYCPTLSDRDLARLGEQVGSDVPYCVMGGTMLAEGRGEVLTELPPLPPCCFVICKPEFSVSTPRLFAALDAARIRRRPDTQGALEALRQGDLNGLARRMYNVFEDVLPEAHRRQVELAKSLLIQGGALGSVMTGTGSAVFGLFAEESAAREAAPLLEEEFPQVFLAKNFIHPE